METGIGALSTGLVSVPPLGDFEAAEVDVPGRLRPRPPRPRRRRGRPVAPADCDPGPLWAALADDESESEAASILCSVSTA